VGDTEERGVDEVGGVVDEVFRYYSVSKVSRIGA
jgi:hypothetical protein